MTEAKELGLIEDLADGELLVAAREGDLGAYEELYRRHARAARSLAARLTNRIPPDDIVSEAFLRVLISLRAQRGPDIAFRPYLMTAIRRQVIDQVAKVPAEMEHDPFDDAGGTVAAPDDATSMRDTMRRALLRLPHRWRVALWKTEVEGLPARELGEELGISANTAAALAYRAREGLRAAYLDEQLADAARDACASFHTKLPGCVRQELSSADRDKLEIHLRTCEDCQRALNDLARADRRFLTGGITAVLLAIGTAVSSRPDADPQLALSSLAAPMPSARRVTRVALPAVAAGVAAIIVSVLLFRSDRRAPQITTAGPQRSNPGSVTASAGGAGSIASTAISGLGRTPGLPGVARSEPGPSRSAPMGGREPVIARFGAPIALPAAASSMATDPSSGLLYAVDGPGGAVSVIDERTKTVLGTPIEFGIPLGAIAMDPLTHRAFVASADAHLVVVIDELTGRSERQSIALPARPTHLATAAPGAVVAILDNGTAVTIDAGRLALTGDPIALGGVVKPDASVVASAHRLYVADVDRRAVLTADLDAHSVIDRSERIAISPVQLHVDAGSNSLLVRDGDGRCVRLDLATDRELDRLELGSAVSASVFDVRSGTLYLVAADRLVQVAGTPRLAEIFSTSLATSTDRGGGALLVVDDGSGVVFAADAGTVTAFQRR